MTCEHYSQLITAYIQDELSPTIRRRVMGHLNTCETCYVLYRQELDLVRHLTETIPLIGTSPQPPLKRVWSVVETELAQPTPRQRFDRFQARYGLAMLLFALMLIVPMTMGNGGVTWAAPPTQPAPQTVTMNQTPTHPAAVGTAVAYYTATEGHVIPDVRPEPDTTAVP